MCKIQIRKIKLNRSTKFYVVRVDSGLRRKSGGEESRKQKLGSSSQYSL